MTEKVIITGIGNSGKTTLFNNLTGSNERVGNWYGITVKSAEAKIKVGDNRLIAYDLPGIYLDGSYTLENKASTEILKSGGYTAILVAEAANLKKTLMFYSRLCRLTQNIVLVINMYGELERAGGRIDGEKLSKLLGCKVVFAECNDTKQVERVKNSLEGCGRAKVISQSMAEQIADECLIEGKFTKNKWDKIFLSPKLSVFAFLVLSVFVLWLAFGNFGLGSLLSFIVEKLFDAAISLPIGRLLAHFGANQFISGAVCNGVLDGVKSVIVFLPQMAVLSLSITYLEESGALARIAFSVNRIFARYGISGRAVFTLLSGYGCTALAVTASNGVEDERIKRRLCLALPFIPCSAKMPVFLFLLSKLGAKFGFLFVVLFFMLGFACALCFCRINSAIERSECDGIIIELPPYRRPKTICLLKSLQNFCKQFIMKVGGTVTVVTFALWLLSNLTLSFGYANGDASNSILAFLGKGISFAFIPMGINDWRYSVAALGGLFAKESVISVISMFGCDGLSTWSTAAYLTFCAIYPPCITALSVIRKEVGMKHFVHVLCFQTVLAFALSYAVYYLKYVAIVLLTALLLYCLLKNKSSCMGCDYERICGEQKNKTDAVSAGRI